MSLSTAASSAIPAIVVGFFAAALISLLVTPLVRRYARRLRVVDRPDPRRVNTRTIARGGGTAIAFAFLSVSVVLIMLNGPGGLHFVAQPHEIGAGHILALVVGGILAVAIGGLDDFFQLRARWQFAGQLLLAGLAVACGVTITSLNVPLALGGTLHPPVVLAAILTVFWIVGMINSINFIDGLDGLSSGIALIAAVTLGGISLTQDISQPFVALLCFVLAGALLGFLRWNFHPAKIFAGTSGIVFIGYTLAVLSVLGTAKIAVAMLVLGVPIIDTFWIIVRRLLERRSPFSPDRGHIHHRLLDLGLSHRNTVLLIYGICALLAVLSFSLSGTGPLYAFMGLVLFSGLALYAITKVGGGSSDVDRDLEAATYDRAPDTAEAAETAETAAPRDGTGPNPASIPRGEGPAVTPSEPSRSVPPVPPASSNR